MPRSIRIFQTLLALSVLVELGRVTVGWRAELAAVRADPNAVALGLSPGGAAAALVSVTALYLTVVALLWFLVVRRASAVAAVVFGGLVAAFAISLTLQLARSGAWSVPALWLTMVEVAAMIAAAAMLARVDSRAWFAAKRDAVEVA